MEKSKPAGRPPLGDAARKMVSIRLSPEVREWLGKQESKTATIENAIRKLMEEEK